jgi:acid-sensing ion channel, other
MNSTFCRVSRDFWSTQNFTPRSPKGIRTKKVDNMNRQLLKASSKSGNGLRMVMENNKVFKPHDFCSPLSFIVHSPFELPGSYDDSETVLFDFGYEQEVLITPEIIRTDEDLKGYGPHERGCYFPGERKLRYFQVYTRRNCEFECFNTLLNTDQTYNCTPFYVIRDQESEVCDYRSKIDKDLQIILALRNISKCGCLDECESIKYKTEIMNHKLHNPNETIIDIKFKEVDIVPLIRYQPFTFSNFLAQAGGMLGLFAGISMLSIVELSYFLSLRWMVNLWRWLRTGRRNR